MHATRRAVALAAALAGCLGAVAYAAAPQRSAPPAPARERVAERGLTKPSLTQHPDTVSVSASARFGFTARARRPRFQCRLDASPWRSCRSPVAFTRLEPGLHRFSVRLTGSGGSRSRPASFRWRVLEPQSFSISPQLAGLAKLYPGAAPQPLPLTISNPNPVPIFVTSVAVTAGAGGPGCTGAENLALTAASVSSANPLRVPAHGAVELPAPGIQAPEIQLRDLPSNQDACQGTSFPLSFAGSARG